MNNNSSENTLENILINIDTDFKAYLIGLIAAIGIFTKEKVIINVHKRDTNTLIDIREKVHSDLHIKTIVKNVRSLYMPNNFIKPPGNILSQLNEDLSWAFIRGYFDGNGEIFMEDNRIYCDLIINYSPLKTQFQNICKLPYVNTSNGVLFEEKNALDFLGKIYANSTIHFESKYKTFNSAIVWKSTHNIYNPPIFRWSKTCDEAIPPTKNRLSDSGYDLHVIKKIKECNGVHYYDTCIKVQLDFGYYFDLVGRSSISKTGWMLANNIGIIDQTYTGTIIVALVKICKDAMPIELPCKIVQLIPRKVIILNMKEVEPEEIGKTERGDSGGLGSKQFN